MPSGVAASPGSGTVRSAGVSPVAPWGMERSWRSGAASASGGFGKAPSVIEAPTPEITAPDEVLVAVKAASLNRFDAVVAAGFFQGMLEHQFPVTLGRDFAGVVEAVGDGVTEFSVGDEVFGMIGNMVLSNGSLADHVVVSAQHLAHKPETIGFTEAAALPLAGSTALAAVDWVQAGPGKAVLIVGATGGVGNCAIPAGTCTWSDR